MLVRSVPKSTRTDRDAAAAVAVRVRHFRRAAGITQETLARAAKLTPKFVSQIENGHVNPSIGVLARIVEDGLRLPLAAFFASHEEGDFRPDLAKLITMFANQPLRVRRLAMRVLEAVCDESAESL